MAQYELIFELPPISEATEDAICDLFDAVTAVHQSVVTITLTAEGVDCVSAARHAVNILEAHGAKPRRLVDDLVSRSMIAERLDVSRQAVGLWISGQRHAESAFPAPFVTVAGGLWRWADVAPFAQALGYELDDIHLPSRTEAQVINGEIANSTTMYATRFASWDLVSGLQFGVGVSKDRTPSVRLQAPTVAQADDFERVA